MTDSNPTDMVFAIASCNTVHGVMSLSQKFCRSTTKAMIQSCAMYMTHSSESDRNSAERTLTTQQGFPMFPLPRTAVPTVRSKAAPGGRKILQSKGGWCLPLTQEQYRFQIYVWWFTKRTKTSCNYLSNLQIHLKFASAYYNRAIINIRC